MSKVVWIINQDASSPETGYGGRCFYFAKMLARKGYKVKLVAAGYHHLMHSPPKMLSSYKIEENDGFEIVWINVPRYKGAKSKLRILNWFIFAARLTRLVKVLNEKPGSIIYSSPSLIGFLGAERLAMRCSAKLIFDVRDIWPLTLVYLGGFSRKNPFIWFMQKIEDRAYKKSDIVTSNLSNSYEHMMSRGLDVSKFFWIPNGFDSDEMSSSVPVPEKIYKAVPKNKFVVGYTGSIGTSNAIDVLINAAEKLVDVEDIVFVIIGEGEEKSAIIKYVNDNCLHNVIFFNRVSKREVLSTMRVFSCCFIGARNEPLYRYGVGANKIPEYLCSAKPVIMAYSGEGNPVEMAEAGVVVPSGDPKSLAEAILKLYHLPSAEREAMGVRGRRYAYKTFDYVRIADKLSKLL